MTSRIQINFAKWHFWPIILKISFWEDSDFLQALDSLIFGTLRFWETNLKDISVYFVFEPNKARNYGHFWATFSSEDFFSIVLDGGLSLPKSNNVIHASRWWWFNLCEYKISYFVFSKTINIFWKFNERKFRIWKWEKKKTLWRNEIRLGTK